MRLVILALALLPTLARAADPVPEDWQAALTEANQHIAGLSQRAESLAMTVAQQAREIAKLKAEAAKPAPTPAPEEKKP